MNDNETEELDEDALFAEMAAEREGTNIEAADAALDTSDTPREKSADEKDDLPGATDEGSDGGAVAAAGADESDQEAGADAGKDKSAGEAEEDPFKGWPQAAIDQYQAQLAENEKLSHRIKSDAGRVAAFQRKSEALESELSAIRENGGKQPTNADIAAAMETDEDWAAFSEEHPEIAAAIDKRIEGSGKKQAKEVETLLAPIREARETGEREKRENEVTEVFPNWKVIPSTPEFGKWLNDQPVEVISLINSDDPRDASSLFGLYDNYLVASGKPSIKKSDLLKSDVDKSARKPANRNQQLEDGAVVHSKPAGITEAGEGLDEYDRIWAAEAAKREKRNRQQA